MTLSDSTWNRLALIATLVKGHPGLGRTAVMKLPFFLVALRSVPLDYDFRLYTYGPFDSNVLDDLSYAESLGAVKSELIPNPRGYGYQIWPGPRANDIEARGSKFLGEYRADVEWVLGKFGSCQASTLELLSTIVYVDREARGEGEKLSLDELATQVHEIKPHFSKDVIRSQAEALLAESLLVSIV